MGAPRGIPLRKCEIDCNCGKHKPASYVHKKGYKLSLEVRAHQSKAQKERPRSDEERANMNFSGFPKIPWNKGLRWAKKPFALVKNVVYHWRQAVLKRDNYQCQICGTTEGKLDIDHIIPKWERPDLIYSISNGRVLCRPCHRQTSTFGRLAPRRGTQYQLPLPMVTP